MNDLERAARLITVYGMRRADAQGTAAPRRPTQRDERIDWIVPVTFGHGSYGWRCVLCDRDDWPGELVHHPDCPAVPDTEALHPAPTYEHKADHREAHNREQLRTPSELAHIWKRAVESLAAELQIGPLEAHDLLGEAEGEVTKGIALEWWS